MGDMVSFLLAPHVINKKRSPLGNWPAVVCDFDGGKLGPGVIMDWGQALPTYQVGNGNTFGGNFFARLFSLRFIRGPL